MLKACKTLVTKALGPCLAVMFSVAIAAPVYAQQPQRVAPSESPVLGPSAPGTPSLPQKPSDTTKEPKPELERPTVWGEPTKVYIGVYVADIDEVNSADQSFAGSVYLAARWNIPALRHEGPGPLHRAWTEIWTPRLVIVNLQQAWRAFPESVEILPSGEVIYRQLIWGKFSQPLDLRNFPEDQQKLAIQIAAVGLHPSEVQMVPLPWQETTGIAPSFSLPDFYVVSWKAGSHPYITVKGQRSVAGYRMEITIRRAITYYVVKIIIPLCFIVMMSWIPLWINPHNFGANLGIAATTFLTLIAYLFAINVLLPRVSYVTRLDRFIILSMLMVFSGLMQTVMSIVLVENQRARLAIRLNFWSRALYPALLVVVVAVSFW